MRIKIVNPAAVRLELQPGDEIIVSKSSPVLDNLIASRRADGEAFAHLVHDDDPDEGETATVSAKGETATTGRARREQRTAAIS